MKNKQLKQTSNRQIKRNKLGWWLQFFLVTQRELAQKTGLTEVFISNIVNNRTIIISTDSFDRIANAFTPPLKFEDFYEIETSNFLIRKLTAAILIGIVTLAGALFINSRTIIYNNCNGYAAQIKTSGNNVIYFCNSGISIKTIKND